MHDPSLKLCFLVLSKRISSPLHSTSCLLISLVEKVLFWWTSRLSDHRVLFLRLVGVGPTPLLVALRDIPGDLLDMD